MEAFAMSLVLNRIHIVRDNWSLSAHGEFGRGLHLVSGEVGSGKSTLALLMTGLIRPESGAVERPGISSCMLSLQFPEYHITGLTLAGECESWGLDWENVLCSTGLSRREDTAPLSLSRGELKRFHLACVLGKEYDLLILDEPFSALDCCQKELLCGILSRKSGGITVIFTHEQTILPPVNRLWEIVDGRLLDLGTPPDAIMRWRNAPPLIKKMTAAGRIPQNLSIDALMEAQCRTQG
jgi:energy-coupling factor transport system ATP-binding protein